MITDLVSRWEDLGDLRVAALAGFIALLVLIAAASYLVSRRRAQTEPRSNASDPLPLREHFRELRSRVMISMVALLLGSAVCFYFYEEILTFLIAPARKVGR